MLYVNGGLIGNPSRAFATALSVVNVLAATRLQGSIEEFKAEAAGDFANDATTLETRTWLAAVFSRGERLAGFHQPRAGGDLRDDARRRAARRAYLSGQSDDRARSSPRHESARTNGAAVPLAMKVALVHDYLNQRGGAERVFARIARAWPDAPIYHGALRRARRRRSLPRARACAARISRASPLRTATFARSRRSIRAPSKRSTSAASTRSSARRPRGRRACAFRPARSTSATSTRSAALHSPTTSTCRTRVARPFVDRLIAWDREAAKRPTRFVANSHNVAERIRRYYGRDADVLHCPVDVDRFSVGSGSGDYFIVASRLLPYKRIDLAIRAAALAGVKLFVAGTGPAERSLRERAKGTTTTMLGYVSGRAAQRAARRRARRDRSGRRRLRPRPARGGRGRTSDDRLSRRRRARNDRRRRDRRVLRRPDCRIARGVLRDFDASRFDPQRLREHAEKFAPAQFIERLRAIVERVYREKTERGGEPEG